PDVPVGRSPGFSGCRAESSTRRLSQFTLFCCRACAQQSLARTVLPRKKINPGPAVKERAEELQVCQGTADPRRVHLLRRSATTACPGAFLKTGTRFREPPPPDA